MGYVLRVRLASFFTGVATASLAGLYFLHKDYTVAHEAVSQQIALVRGIVIYFSGYNPFYAYAVTYNVVPGLNMTIRKTYSGLRMVTSSLYLYMVTGMMITSDHHQPCGLLLPHGTFTFLSNFLTVSSPSSIPYEWFRLVKGVYESLDERISALEKLKVAETSQPVAEIPQSVEATE